MTLWKQVLAFAVVLGGLVMWERTLSQRHSQARLEAQRIAPFVPPGTFDDRPVAAIKLTGAGDPLLYVLHENIWRTFGFNSAPALASRVTAILPSLAAAQGVVQTRDPNEAAKYGFNEGQSFQLTFCGPLVLDDPTGDIIYVIDVGHSIASTGGCYARVANSNEIWAIDVDFRRIIGLEAQVGGRLPPMVDPHLIPEAWEGFRRGIRRVVIERAGQPPLICTRRRIDPDAPADQQPPTLWQVRRESEMHDGQDLKFLAFMRFLTRAPFMGIPGRRTAEELGLAQPRGKIRLEPSEGPPLELVVGGPSPHGGVIVYNTFSATVFEVDRQVGGLLLPELEDLVLPSQGSLWDEWMR